MSSARRPITLSDAAAITDLWLAAGGAPEAELGALEPLLWSDGPLRAPDLVHAIASKGVRVSMTTNGSMLSQYAGGLKAAGLALLRVSWHTTDPETFLDVSGTGDYASFMAGLKAAMQVGLRVSFNRVLLKGHTADLDRQLDLIEAWGARLKLYDLLWTPQIAERYYDMYLDWRPIVREFVLPRTASIQRLRSGAGRNRLRFMLRHGGHVEVKVGDGLDRSGIPCSTCSHKAACLEQFGDYVRVEPEADIYFCYLRRDLTFNVRDLLASPSGPERFRSHIEQVTGRRADAILQGSSLRFIAVPFCNFNCSIPGTSTPWCHKASGNYRFASRAKVGQARLVTLGSHGGGTT